MCLEAVGLGEHPALVEEALGRALVALDAELDEIAELDGEAGDEKEIALRLGCRLDEARACDDDDERQRAEQIEPAQEQGNAEEG